MTPKQSDLMLTIYKKQQTVFSLKELTLLFPNIAYQNLKRRINYFVKVGKLKRPRRGLYAKENYSSWELANKIYTPSYISLETVLAQDGVIFQAYKSIFLVSYLSRRLSVDNNDYYYRKINESILYNKDGINLIDNCYVATKERAFLDAVFLYRDYHFDNLSSINWELVDDLVKIYKSKTLDKRIKEYKKYVGQE